MEKQYRLKVSSPDEYAEIPAVAVVAIDKKHAERIVELAGLVQRHSLFAAQDCDESVTYLMHDPQEEPEEAAEAGEENECPVDLAHLVVLGDWFYFEANLKNTDVALNTDIESVEELAAAHGIAYVPQNKAAGDAR